MDSRIQIYKPHSHCTQSLYGDNVFEEKLSNAIMQVKTERQEDFFSVYLLYKLK